MKIGVCGNKKRADVCAAMLELRQSLALAGFDVCSLNDVCEIGGVDVLVVLGGDGTIIHTAGAAAKKGIPVVGVNYGTVGFLAQFEKHETEQLIAYLKDFSACTPVLKRSVLQMQFGEKNYFALNEIAVQRDYTDLDSQIMATEVSFDGVDALCMRGDGVLLSTPTGSTAYSLSAGGAILAPNAAVLMLTPICSFSLNARPLVVPDDVTVCLTVSQSKAVVLVDGREMLPFVKGDVITVKKAAFTADFPQREGSGFLKTVGKKLK